MTDARPDRLTRFLLPAAGVRGVHVRLGDTWQEIRRRSADAGGAAELLGEGVAASALLTGHAKVDGRLSLQLRGQGALRTLFAECTAAGTLRGIAQVEEGADAASGLAALGGGPLLAITIENPGPGGREPIRYQGLVPIEGDDLAASLEAYFRQSEQLPSRLLLAADDRHACGLMLQKLPGDADADADGWDRASALFDTLAAAELLATPGEALLHRLFHEEAPEVLAERPLRFGCSCSQARVEGMLQALGRDEAEAAVIDGAARIRCEFCGEQYRLGPGEVAALFATPVATAEAPERLQ